MPVSNSEVFLIAAPQLRRDEGLRLKPYRDSLGYWTWLYGHRIVGAVPNPDMSGTLALAEEVLTNDMGVAANLCDQNIPWWRDMDAGRAAVLLMLMFNMGWRSLDGKHGLSTFVHTLALIKSGAYVLAASNMMQSVWAKQVGARAQQLANQMRSGISGPLKPSPPKRPPFAQPPVAVIIATPTAAVVAGAAMQVHWSPMLIVGVCAIVLALAAVVIASFTYWRLTKMSAALDRVTASVGALETAVTAATAEIASLKAGSDDAALNGLADRVDAATASLTTATAPTT